MPRRIQKKPSLLTPLTENLFQRLSGSDSRLRRTLIRYGFWVIGLMFAWSLVSGTYGIPRIIRLELKRDALIEANRQSTIDLIDADRLRRLLSEDPGYIEQIARTRFHMAQPNEIIYRYQGR